MSRWQKKKPGDPLKIPAGAWNALLELLEQRDNFLAQLGKTGTIDTRIKVRNETGQPIPRFGVIGMGEPIILPTTNLAEFQSQVAFRGTLPQPGKPFAITQEPIPAGAIGCCVVSGPTPVKVSIYDPDPEAQWAEPIQNNVEALRTCRGGSMRILWREPGDTGDKWAIAVFQPNPHPLVRVRLMASLSKDSGQLVNAELLTRGADGLYVPPTGYSTVIPVGDLSGLGFSAPAMTKATAVLHFGLTINDVFHEVIGILTDIRC